MPLYIFASKCAFTLAEILITLSIIGIVAVLTVPSVITSYQKKVVPVKLEKFYVEMVNAIRLSEMYNGKMATWTFPTSVSNPEQTEEFFNKYLAKYLNYTKTERADTTLKVYLNNGLYFNLHVSSYADKYIHFFVKTNKDKYQIEFGKFNPKNDFVFLTSPDVDFKPYMLPYTSQTFTRDIAMNNSTYGRKGSTSNEPVYCVALIMLDGWKIADDYPW